jgi:hypothetical protein
MASQFDAAGFDDLRAYIKNNWNWIADIDSGGGEQLRWDILNNSNVTITSDATGNPLTAELTITGQDLKDAGATLPVTLSSTEVYKSSSATTRMAADTMSDATFDVAEDELTITHDYNLPP